jgi:hypothetical protein
MREPGNPVVEFVVLGSMVVRADAASYSLELVDHGRSRRFPEVSDSFVPYVIAIMSCNLYNCGSDGNGGHIVVRPDKLFSVFEGIDDEATNHPMG